MFTGMNDITLPAAPEGTDAAVEIDHEVDGETLRFATEADADAYALTDDESYVAARVPLTG